MKKHIPIAVFSLLFVWLVACPVWAQQERIEQVLSLGLEDAQKIFEAYNAPLGRTIGFAMSDGWHETAQPLKRWQTNFRFVQSSVVYPAYAQKYNLIDLNLKNAVVIAGDSSAPTAIGERGDLSILRNRLNDSLVFLPKGLGLIYKQYAFFPAVYPQFNIGLFRNTELSVRFLPNVVPLISPFVSDIPENISMSYWGVGLMHDLKQWIPSIALAPFSLSVWGSYSSAKMSYPLKLTSLGPQDPRNQLLRYEVKAYSLGAVASKKIAFLTVFGGLQYDKSISTNRLEGTYKVGDEIINNPLEQTYEGQRIAGNLGAKVRFKQTFVMASAVFSQYTTLSIAIGFGSNNP